MLDSCMALVIGWGTAAAGDGAGTGTPDDMADVIIDKEMDAVTAVATAEVLVTSVDLPEPVADTGATWNNKSNKEI